MKFTTEELELISDALKGYEDSWDCGENDEYWKTVRTLARRIDLQIGKQQEIVHGQGLDNP